MWNFFKIFFASLLALFIFSLLAVFFLVAMLGGMASKDRPRVQAKSVIVLDLAQHYEEQVKQDPLAFLSSDNKDIPGLYDVIRLLHIAKTDKNVAGIYVIANNNPNGFAASEELRNSLKDFKTGGKFILAHGDVITQKAYSVANIADKIYVSPQGYVEWAGYSVEYAFLKGTLQKLEIEPQVFYAGKFKSATEPLRTDEMTPENELQTAVWLNDLYNDLLINTAEVRKIDTATLHQLANEAKIQNAKDAMDYKLVDALKYDDELKDEIKAKLGIGKYDKINFITINTYLAATNMHKRNGEKIALIYAEGNIVDGKSDEGIGGETYRNLVRKARLDKSIKAIVFRVNSGGGSSMASEAIWRELALAKKEKPVIVSFGDVAASGGYYMSCNSDSIFAQPNTITGSIGVFSLLPNMQNFFNHKLGITFDGVKTSENADALTVIKPLTPMQRQYIQNEVDTIYHDFKSRVSEGRKKSMAYVDSIGQGRVWSGSRALQLGLVDRLGGLKDAIASAANLAKLKDYRLREYPDPPGIFEQFFGGYQQSAKNSAIEKDLGTDGMKTYSTLKKVKQLLGITQTRMPFDFVIH